MIDPTLLSKIFRDIVLKVSKSSSLVADSNEGQHFMNNFKHQLRLGYSLAHISFLIQKNDSRRRDYYSDRLQLRSTYLKRSIQVTLH